MVRGARGAAAETQEPGAAVFRARRQRAPDRPFNCLATDIHANREFFEQTLDIFLKPGVHIETGPHKHAVQQTFFLHVYEPGSNRVEVANAGARLVLAPDWKPITWTETERRKNQARA
jgi:hypothetical protein